MVLQPLGNNLQQLFLTQKKKLSYTTVANFATQAGLHGLGYVHTNLQPEKFLIGDDYTPDHIYLCGLKDALPYLNSKGEHLSVDQNIPDICPKTQFSSLNRHLNLAPSRRDDLESLGLIMLYFLSEGKICSEDSARSVTSIPLEKLCKDYPIEIYEYMIAVRALKFDTEPSYNELTDRFKSMLAKYASKQNPRGVPFDWLGTYIPYPPKQDPNTLSSPSRDLKNAQQRKLSVVPEGSFEESTFELGISKTSMDSKEDSFISVGNKRIISSTSFRKQRMKNTDDKSPRGKEDYDDDEDESVEQKIDKLKHHSTETK